VRIDNPRFFLIAKSLCNALAALAYWYALCAASEAHAQEIAAVAVV
jgi:hypothetical protein